jgi:hypothetical protein
MTGLNVSYDPTGFGPKRRPGQLRGTRVRDLATFDPRGRVEGFGAVPLDLNVGPSRPTDER